VAHRGRAATSLEACRDHGHTAAAESRSLGAGSIWLRSLRRRSRSRQPSDACRLSRTLLFHAEAPPPTRSPADRDRTRSVPTLLIEQQPDPATLRLTAWRPVVVPRDWAMQDP